MRFLIDNNLSPRLGSSLRDLGHDATHISELGLARAPDEKVLEEAAGKGAILITADTDFPEFLALSGATRPSVIYLRGRFPTQPDALAALLERQLGVLRDALEAGAVVAIEGDRMRIRLLPIRQLDGSDTG